MNLPLLYLIIDDNKNGRYFISHLFYNYPIILLLCICRSSGLVG